MTFAGINLSLPSTKTSLPMDTWSANLEKQIIEGIQI